MTTARNLWHHSDLPYSQATFSYPGKCLFTHRGVQVFKNPAGSYDYILAGAAIAQRAGFTVDRGTVVIDDLLDNHQPCSDPVAKHIDANGGHALTYAQYSWDFSKGLRA